MKYVLIIDDEAGLLDGLFRHLRLEGFDVTRVRDGARGLREAREGRHDLIVLNVCLPSLDGYQICTKLREEGDGTPILMFGADTAESDRVLGLELGADDFVTERCGIRELRSRVRALLRRAKADDPHLVSIRLGDLEVDFQARTVTRKGLPVTLTPTEFELLRTLVEHRGEALDRDFILTSVWEEDLTAFPRTVDSHIAHLRKKLEEDPSDPEHIVSVRGVGYRFDA